MVIIFFSHLFCFELFIYFVLTKAVSATETLTGILAVINAFLIQCEQFSAPVTGVIHPFPNISAHHKDMK